jgi:adenine-specific DNA-methyltransferase
MALNAEDSGTRRCISVQLPEPCDESSEAFKAGFNTIADIAKERIRRAGSKIRAEWEEKNAAREAAKSKADEKQAGDLFSAASGDSSSSHPRSTISDPPSLPPDTGFRVFKLAPSNFRRWDGEAAAVSKEALAQQLEASLDHIATGATEESILFEILLKAGYELTCPMEKLELAGRTVYAIDGLSLFICVEDRINTALIDAVAEKHPVQFICLDRALQGNDSLKVNTLETFRACQPEIQFRTV